MIATIPYRYDLPYWSCINKEISRVNSRIRYICNQHKNTKIISLDDLSCRYFGKRGKPGIHMNEAGKFRVAQKIKSLMMTNESVIQEINNSSRQKQEFQNIGHGNSKKKSKK